MLIMFSASSDPTDEESLQEKALLDTEELREMESFSVAPSDKVELDLDDAPFLEEDEDEEPEQQYDDSAPVEMETSDSTTVPFYKQRKFILIMIGVALLLLGLIVTILFWPDTERVEAPPDQVDPMAPEVVETEEFPPFEWDPFVVELRDSDGRIRFLYIRLAAPVGDNEKLLHELRAPKLMKVRDSIYYYLKNKDIAYLGDEDNEDTLKKNLLAVINQQLAYGPLEDLYILEYLVK